MALDGFTLSSIVYELKNTILGGRIDKVHQPEKDEIILHIRSKGNAYKLLLTATAGSPRLHFTEIAKENPLTAPLFCMVLRKYLMSGKIVDITQPNFERILNIHVESIDELGDYSEKILILEIMGRHSNIILTNKEGKILESINHVSLDMSSVRPISPNRMYTLPPNQDKKDPLNTTRDEFLELVKNSEDLKLYKLYNGFSPILIKEILASANIDENVQPCTLSEEQFQNLFISFDKVVSFVRNNEFSSQIIYDKEKLVDFTAFEYEIFKDYEKLEFESISKLLEYFYKSKDLTYRLNQKSSDLKKLITQNIERCMKKRDIQKQTLKDISNREQLKLFGELITSNIYAIKKGMDKVVLNNFYSEDYEEVEILLKTNLTPAENAQKYFKKYNKEKRTFIAINEQSVQNEDELVYLESVLSSVQTCKDERDIKEIRDELAEQGFLKKKKDNKKNKNTKKAKPMHYISSDGFHIYVGKNNTQNDELTLKFAKSLDMWLHTKNIAGSHIIIVADGREISDTAINEGANLAVYYSKASNSSSVAVDYTPRKFVKKPNGSKPGMVIYETNKTAFITPDKTLIEKLEFLE